MELPDFRFQISCWKRAYGGSFEECVWQAALADHRAKGAYGDVFAGMGDDDRMPKAVPVFGVAAAL